MAIPTATTTSSQPVNGFQTDFNNHSGSWLSNVEASQNLRSSRNLTPSNAYLLSEDTSSYDNARISSGYANDNCYHESHIDLPSIPH